MSLSSSHTHPSWVPPQNRSFTFLCYGTLFIEELYIRNKVHKSWMGSLIIFHIYIWYFQDATGLSFSFKTHPKWTTLLTLTTLYDFCPFFNFISVESFSEFSFKALTSLLNILSEWVTQVTALVMVHFCCLAFHCVCVYYNLFFYSSWVDIWADTHSHSSWWEQSAMYLFSLPLSPLEEAKTLHCRVSKV